MRPAVGLTQLQGLSLALRNMLGVFPSVTLPYSSRVGDSIDGGKTAQIFLCNIHGGRDARGRLMPPLSNTADRFRCLHYISQHQHRETPAIVSQVEALPSHFSFFGSFCNNQ